MAKNYQYCVAENWGKGFIEANESISISFRQYPGNVWRVPAYNKTANLWINKVLGTPKTVQEAQEIVNSVISSEQTAWDNDTLDGETVEEKNLRIGTRPADIVLEE